MSFKAARLDELIFSLHKFLSDKFIIKRQSIATSQIERMPAKAMRVTFTLIGECVSL